MPKYKSSFRLRDILSNALVRFLFLVGGLACMIFGGIFIFLSLMSGSGWSLLVGLGVFLFGGFLFTAAADLGKITRF